MLVRSFPLSFFVLLPIVHRPASYRASVCVCVCVFKSNISHDAYAMQADDETLCSPIYLIDISRACRGPMEARLLEYLPDSTQRTVSVVRPRQIAQVPIYELASHLGFRDVDQILQVTVSSCHTQKSLSAMQKSLLKSLKFLGETKGMWRDVWGKGSRDGSGM